MMSLSLQWNSFMIRIFLFLASDDTWEWRSTQALSQQFTYLVAFWNISGQVVRSMPQKKTIALVQFGCCIY